MDFIQTSNKQVDKFGVGKHGFSAGDPGGGVPATYFSNLWADGVQQEIINSIEAAGLVPSGADLSQLLKAIQILARRRSGAWCAAGGTVDAITGDFSPDVPLLVDGLTVAVRSSGANTSSTPTFKADGTAVTTIVKENNQPLLPGDIPGTGFWMILLYDATLARWVLMNPAGKIGAGYLLVQDQKTLGTTAGSSVVGVNTRTLNTVVVNTIPGASLSGNQVTLPAGTYRVYGNPAAISNLQRACLYNVTDAAVAIVGCGPNGFNSGTSDPGTVVSEIRGRITINAPKVFEIRHWTDTAGVFGSASNHAATGSVEVYTSLEFIKEV